MGVLKAINWNFFYLPLFDLNQYLYLISDYIFCYTLNANIFINTIITGVLITNASFIFTIKLILTIMFLILIRGGTPRYRYDYLTKLGWLKFFGLTVTFFLTLLFLYGLF